MNQNRKYKKAGAVGISVVMAMALGVGGVMAHANGAKEQSFCEVPLASHAPVETNKEKTTSETKNTNKVFKDEVVYAYTDASGKVNKVTVSEWLKNSAGKNILEDKTMLQNIENVKGEETFAEGNNDTILWNTDNQDIYYQGTTSENLPVSMEITYYLYGQKISPEELAGKCGSLEMHVTYQNHSRQTVQIDDEEIKVNTPFAMATAMILPDDNFKNVNIDHGKILADGNRMIVIGLGMPGMKESLDIDEDVDVEIPESFVVTADVTDFKMSSVFTVATSDLFEDYHINSNTMDELNDSLNELTDASLKLVDGSGDLSKGIKTLKDSTKEFTDGIKSLSEGAGTLSKGADSLQNGTKEYTNGVEHLAGGVKQYVDGTTTLADGVISYTKGTKKLQQGIQNLNDQTKELPKSLNSLSKGIQTYGTGVNTLISEENMTSFTSGLEGLAAGIEKLNQGLEAVSKGVDSVHQNLVTLEESYSNNEQLIASLKDVLTTMEDGQQKSQIQAIVTNLETVTATQKAGVGALKNATAKDSQLGSGLAALSENTNENGALSQGAKTLSSAAHTMATAAVELRTAYPKLEQGAMKLEEAGKNLPAAMKQLTTGAAKLVSNNKNLQKGSNELKTSGKTLYTGAKSLQENSASLMKGVKKLNSGLDTLFIGTSKLESGAAKLSGGVNDLFDGSIDLKKGMEEFNQDGIEKLTGTVEDDLEHLVNRINAIAQAGKDYNSYGGIQKEMDGKVKFIMKSDEIK